MTAGCSRSPARLVVSDRRGARGRALCAAAVIGLLAPCLSGCAAKHPDPVVVFPIPGSRVASPSAQIVFRGIPISQLGKVIVKGSRSGVHDGRLAADSDGEGGSFLPRRSFRPGERVTVKVRPGRSGVRIRRFSFTVATPLGPIPKSSMAYAARRPGDVVGFHSRPDLVPPAVRIDVQAGKTAPDDIFIAPERGPVQSGPMILAPDGSLVWFHPLPKGQVATDFRAQRYRGEPVLTWFEGYIGSGSGNGADHIVDSSYRPVAVVRAANGLVPDMHEFLLLPGGKALITAYFALRWDASSLGASKHQAMLEGVVQEIDVKTGLLLYQWDSLDHVPVRDGYTPPPRSANYRYDYFHINSAQLDSDGNLLISSRNTWTVYKVSGQNGRVIWRLGGKDSSFKMGPGASFAFQHDPRYHAPDDRILTLFDNGAGPPTIHRQSRGLTLHLDTKRGAATLIRTDERSPATLAHFEGNLQQLPNGDQFVGWGQRPSFSEFSGGRMIFDGHLLNANPSYRAYRFPWSAAPTASPAVAGTTAGGRTTVYASWNGATNVAYWQVLAGPKPDALAVVRTTPKAGFETAIALPAQAYVAVTALDRRQRILATSRTISVG